MKHGGKLTRSRWRHHGNSGRSRSHSTSPRQAHREKNAEHCEKHARKLSLVHGVALIAPSNGVRLSCARVWFSQMQFSCDGRRQLPPHNRPLRATWHYGARTLLGC